MKSLFRQVVTILAAAVVSTISAQTVLAGGGFDNDKRPALWQGFYVGGHVGGTFGEVEVTSGNDADLFDIDGLAGGVHLGYNFQHGKTVFGIEGDYDFTNAELSNIPVSQDFLASIRGRIGYAMDSTLIYATAGVAWSKLSDNFGDSVDLNGYVFGIGAEHKYSKQLSLRADVLHYDVEGDIDVDHVELNSTVVRAGVSWHLN